MKKILYLALALVFSVSLQAQIDRSVQPKPGPAPKVNIGKAQTFKLPNGLEVLVVENHKLPRVSFTLFLDNPLTVEGNIKGVDDLISAMFGNGTSSISKDDFNEQLDFFGSSVDFSVHSINGSSLSKFFPQTLALVAKGALDPVFIEDELNSERAKLLDAIKADEKSTKAIANRVKAALVFGKDHPQGEFLSEETISNITLSDVQNYYKTNFVPTKAYLVVVGDVTFDEVKKLVTQDFSSWKKAPVPVYKYTDPINLSNTEIDFIDVPNAVQSEISINGVVNLKMTDSDYYAALLANYILGGSSDSYLFMNLREGHGWTYGSYSNMSGSKYTSSFTAYAAVRNSVTDSAVVEMLNEVKRIRTELPTADALSLAKAKFIGSFVMNAEKPQTIAGFALRERTQSLPADFYEKYIQNVESVTLEQVQAAARKYFTDEKARIIIAGKAADVLPGLEKLGIPINYFDKYANPVSKPQAKEIDADVSVNSVLQKYIDAIGGEDALKAIQSLMYTSGANIQGHDMTLVKKETADGKSSQEISAMGMVVLKTVYNGKTGYVVVQGQREDMSEDDLSNLKYSAIFPELLMKNSPTVQLAGIESINGKDAYKLVDGDISYFYDTESGFKVAEGIKKEDAQGQPLDQIGYYDDYREIYGIKIPYKSTINVGVDIDLTVSDVKINEGVSEADFL